MLTENVRKIVPELQPQYEHTVRSVPSRRIAWPHEICAIVDHPLFQRLRSVKQLAFVDRVYPDAGHSRFAHSIGVYGNVIGYVQALLANKWASDFKSSMDDRDLRTVLVAGLLHDLGQYPFAHAIEDSVRSKPHQVGSSDLDHEELTKRLLRDDGFRRSQAEQFGYHGPDLAKLIEKAGTTCEEVVAVLEGTPCRDISIQKSHLLKSLIDGPIDADKLDYLRRDSHHAGVGFGLAIDVGRLLQSLCVAQVPERPDSDPRSEIGVVEKGVSTAEEILVARAHMFTQVYWHRAVRAHEATLATALRFLRLSTEGFDAWLSSMALSPHVGDEGLIEECLRIASGRGDDTVALRGGNESLQLRARAIDLLRSVSVFRGRYPYKRIVSVAASSNRLAHATLQSIRDYSISTNAELLDELGVAFARRLSRFVNVNIDPRLIVTDIPSPRASGNSVLVVSTSRSGRSPVRRLFAHSPTWDTFGSTFAETICKARVFVPADVRAKIEANEHDYRRICTELFIDSAVEVGRKQLSLAM